MEKNQQIDHDEYNLATKKTIPDAGSPVFDVLWDIAVAFFVVRISFVYFILSFISGYVVTYFRTSRLQPVKYLITPQSDIETISIVVLFSVLWARFITANYEVPKVPRLRLMIGALALVFMLIAELLAGIISHEMAFRKWIWESDLWATGFGTGVLGLFGLMPSLLMYVERRG